MNNINISVEGCYKYLHNEIAFMMMSRNRKVIWLPQFSNWKPTNHKYETIKLCLKVWENTHELTKDADDLLILRELIKQTVR